MYKREGKKGKGAYYVRFRDEYGRRMSAISSGKTTKPEAEKWAYEQIQNGTALQHGDMPFGQFAQDFWLWDKCDYVIRRSDQGRIARKSADTHRSYLQNHILPFFKDYKLSKINTVLIESKWVQHLKVKKTRFGAPLSIRTINHCIRTLKTMLSEAVRRDLLPKNPASQVGLLKEFPKARGILSDSEVLCLLDIRNISWIWDDDFKHLALNHLAAITGMRMGEIQALKIKNVFQRDVVVEHSWDRSYGIKGTKGGSVRSVPISDKTSEVLHRLIDLHPQPETESFLFWGATAGQPLYHTSISLRFYRALERIGIEEDGRKKRNIVFHSWRHFLNSLLRRKRIMDATVMAVTGHKSLAMTENYTHPGSDEMDAVRQLQQSFLEEEKEGV